MRHTFRFVFITVTLCSMNSACAFASPTSLQATSQPLDTIVALTSSAALTQTATTSGGQLQQAESTATLVQTQTAAFPITYIYEGAAQSCVCTKCVCVGNVTIDATVTIDAQGHVSGSLSKYLEKMPPIKFEGTKENLYGVIQIGRDEANNVLEEKAEFSGRLNANYTTLEITISASGTYLVNSRFMFSGQQFASTRTFVLFRK